MKTTSKLLATFFLSSTIAIAACSDELVDDSASNDDDTEFGKADKGSGGGGDGRIERICVGRAAGIDVSMDAKHRVRGARVKFDTSFEAAPNRGFEPGLILDVLVEGEFVGEMLLRRAANGDVTGDLNFDTTAGPFDDDLPFPANFPSIGSGTSVDVGPLGCVL